ncbi:MAG: hypothetical protein K2L38_11110 [Dysosmobacter sp.]|nr:hypothetical protein [Dysosmobacter sp.]
MKIRLERCGVVFEYERQPMKESRFRALCALAAAGVYAGMVAAVTALCGFLGLLVVAIFTVFLAMIAGGALI